MANAQISLTAHISSDEGSNEKFLALISQEPWRTRSAHPLVRAQRASERRVKDQIEVSCCCDSNGLPSAVMLLQRSLLFLRTAAVAALRAVRPPTPHKF